MKKILMALILVSIAGLWGLEYIEAEGNNAAGILRETTASFHSGTDDRHFYYTYPETADHRWAVLYDFRTYYEDIDSLLFAVESVSIYLPGPSSSGELTVSLHKAGDLGPGELVESGSALAGELIEGWNEIELGAAADTLYWLVVDYPTGFVTEQYISGSNGDGTHSYYWDPYYGEGSWLNMSANGFNNEFLFSMEGEFSFGAADLEISELSIEGEIVAGNEIQVRGAIHNNYAGAIDSIWVIFDKKYPGNVEHDTIFVDEIGGGATLELPMEGALSYVLNSEPGQYEISMRLSSSNDMMNDNNQMERQFNTFDIERAGIFVENMVELDDSYSDGIWSVQETGVVEEIFAINYFPSYQDLEYYNMLAEERFHYYELYNLPATVVSGEPYLGYLEGNYQENISEMCSEVAGEHSFVTISNITAEVDTLKDVYITVTLDRENNQVLSTYASSCELFGMIYESDLPLNDEISGNIFIDTLSFYQSSLGGLVNTPELNCYTVFNKEYDYTPLEDSLNCYLLFWVQNTDDNKVWAYEKLSFNDFGIVSGDEDEITPVQKVYAYPNPFGYDQVCRIRNQSDRAFDNTQVSVYNLKGQLVKQLAKGENVWDGSNSSGSYAGSGIYLLRVIHDHKSEWLKVAVVK